MSDAAAATRDFFARLEAALRTGTFVRLTLGKPRGTDATLQNIFVRPVTLQSGAQLSFVHRHTTRDVTKNHAVAEALAEIRRLVGRDFHSAHLFATDRSWQLEYNKKGAPRLHAAPAVAAAEATHDRAKERLLPAESQPWLLALGVTAENGEVKTGMADKHRQIHKFVELLSHLAARARFPPGDSLAIADMGCGKGYLTFATHDYFNLVAQQPAVVHGIEVRPALVRACNDVARATGRDATLKFQEGDIASTTLDRLDVLIALHACDTATDDALFRGITTGATLLVVAPCCQKELRPQLTPAPVLAPALRHGIFQERQAEFVTDALRALLLEWAGYDTKVFEFISTEHTAKNVMIAATKRPGPVRDAAAAAKIREFAAFYGIERQALARQLGFELVARE